MKESNTGLEAPRRLESIGWGPLSSGSKMERDQVDELATRTSPTPQQQQRQRHVLPDWTAACTCSPHSINGYSRDLRCSGQNWDDENSSLPVAWALAIKSSDIQHSQVTSSSSSSSGSSRIHIASPSKLTFFMLASVRAAGSQDIDEQRWSISLPLQCGEILQPTKWSIQDLYCVFEMFICVVLR